MSLQLRSTERADAHLAATGTGGGAARRLRHRLAKEGWETGGQGFKFKPGFILVQTRAISASVNQNFDGWPAEELKKSAHTFVGKPVFVNHANSDPSEARGVVVAARYVENGNDKFIETIMEVDAARFPRLAHEIKTGGLDSVSMGAEAGFTICSYCDNRATDLHDMCDHVLHHKGERLAKFNRETGKTEDVLVYEKCYKIAFFELSFVFDPADQSAVASKVLVAGKRTATEITPPKYQVGDLVLAGTTAQRGLKLHDTGKAGEVAEVLGPFGPDNPKNPKGLAGLDQYIEDMKSRGGTDTEWEDFRQNRIGDFIGNGYYYRIRKPGTTGKGGQVHWHEDDLQHHPHSPKFQAHKVGAASCPPGDPTCNGGALIEDSPAAAAPGSSSGTPADPAGLSSSSGGSSGGTPDAQNILPNARPLYDTLQKEFPGSDIGGYRVDNYHEHDRGALDFMNPSNPDKVMSDAFSAGAPYVLWQQQQWNPDGSRSPMEDRGDPTQNHFDHMHIAPIETPTTPTITPASIKASFEHRVLRAAGFKTALQDNSDRTQRSNTLATYNRVHDFFDQIGAPNEGGPDGVLDYGSGLGHSGRWGHTFEPNTDRISPGAGTYPDWIDDKDIPPGRFNRITNLHVLNVVPPEMRERIVKGIGTALAPGGHAVIVTRHRNDVDSTKNKEPVGPSDPGAWYIGNPNKPDERTYQRGFTSDELAQLVGGHLGDGYTVKTLPMGSVAAVHVVKRPARSAVKKTTRRNRLAWGETTAPEKIDTLREEGTDDADDPDDFHRYVSSPKELQTPDLGEAAQIDREQEMQQQGPDMGQGQSGPEMDDQQYMVIKIPVPPQQGKVPMQAFSSVSTSMLDFFDRYYGHKVADWRDAIEARREFTPEERADYRRQATLEKSTAALSTNRNEKGITMGRSSLSERGRVASRGQRKHFAEDYRTDGGDQSRNDQGEQEEVFISQTPGEVPVDMPVDSGNIANTEANLVEALRRSTAQTTALAHRLNTERQRRQGSRRRLAEETATVVNPTVPDPSSEALTGDHFESANPNDGVVDTSPGHEASLRAFQAFDEWLQRSTGQSSRNLRSATIRQAAEQFARQANIPVQAMFPALGIVLRQARKNESAPKRTSSPKGAKMRKRAVDLETAAPDARTDVESPVANTTDADAQASQFKPRDFGNNAGDNISDPDLSTDQNWPPGEGKKEGRKADGILAVRCAEAMIAAGLEPNTRARKYQLAGEYQNMSRGLVLDRIALLERVASIRQAERQAAAGRTRGAARSPLPPGLTQGASMPRVASQRLAANDPSNDSLLFG